MSQYEYLPYKNSITNTNDVISVTYIDGKAIPMNTYPVVYIADECIEKIADAVARKIVGEREEE